MSTASTTLWDQVSQYLAAEGLELDDLEVKGHGGARVVRVTVDGEDLAIDRLADLSRALERMIDETVHGPYTLEVSSPGLERKLKRPEQFIKAVGRNVTVKTHDEINGRRRHDGVLRSADASTITVDIDGVTTPLAYDQVASARTVFTWERNPKPGSKAVRSR